MKPINFTYGAGGKLEFDETTCGTPIVQLGALAYTMNQRAEFSTDLDGLRLASELTGSAIISFSANIESIGELMAYADVENVSKKTLQDIGGLMATLGNYVRTLTNFKMHLDEAEMRLGKDVQKGKK